MMRKKLLLLFAMLILFSSIVAAPADVENINIPVSFTYRSGVNCGFSTTAATKAWKESEFGDTNPIEFVYSPTDDSIQTGPFYFYVQIYTTNKVKVSVNGDFLDNMQLTGVEYEDEDDKISYSCDLTLLDDSGTGAVVYTEDSLSEDERAVPRVFNQLMNLEIDPEELIGKKSETFTGNMAFKVEVT